MNRILQMRALKLCMVLVVFILSAGCSHLNVDFDSSWASRQISVVIVEHQQGPDGVTTTDISEILTREGWHVVSNANQAQARVICRWTRQPDLNSESEPIEVIKSFHVQVISIERPKMLAVSDYFYSNTNEDLMQGVEAALLALTQGVASKTAPNVVATKKKVASAVTSPKTEIAPVTVVPAVSQPVFVEQSVDRVPTAEVSIPVLTTMGTEIPVVPSAVVVDEIVDVSPQEILPMEPVPVVEPIEPIDPVESAEPVSMEISPWVPRFQGMGLDEWGKE